MEWMAKLILEHMKEVNRDAPISDEDLEYRANHLTAQINRTSRARRDFRPERKDSNVVWEGEKRGDSKHEIMDAKLEYGGKLHRFNNRAGVPYSAIYIGKHEVWSHERIYEAKMIEDWNTGGGEIYEKHYKEEET